MDWKYDAPSRSATWNRVDRSTIPFYFQSASQDCVPASVLALARYYGVPTTIRYLRSTLATDPTHGTSLGSLYSLKTMFEVQLGRITEVESIAQSMPFIAYLRHNHAIVVWGYSQDGSRLIAGDPAVGVVELRVGELLELWDGLAAVIRPLPGANMPDSNRAPRQGLLHLTDLRSLRMPWWQMSGVSAVAALLAAANALYSLYWATYLQNYGQFILFMLSYSVSSGVLNLATSLIQLRIGVAFQKKVGMLIDTALPTADLKFYTIGDINTRYQDAVTVVNTVLGLFRDVPYAALLAAGSIYFLWRIDVLLSVFIVAFLALIISGLSPVVRRVQDMVYGIRIKQTELTNRIKEWLSGGRNTVTESFVDLINQQYRQGLWSIPIGSVVGNSAAIPILFVVVFMHWRFGGSVMADTSGYARVLSGIMIMSYAVSAGHGLYGKLVAWQMALPSLERLRDFLGIDDTEVEPAGSEGIS